MLTLEPNIGSPDDFYEALIEAHRGLSEAQSTELNARLILLLANQIGDSATLLAAIAKAGEGIVPEGDDMTMHAVTR